MIIAIVGASKLTENEERDIRQRIGIILNQLIEYNQDVKVISGGASGVDTIAIEIAKGLGLGTIILPPKSNNWDGYRERNIQIAHNCDKLFCFPAILRDKPCHHCQQNHQQSGGCWTANFAKKLKKQVLILEPIKRL